MKLFKVHRDFCCETKLGEIKRGRKTEYTAEIILQKYCEMQTPKGLGRKGMPVTHYPCGYYWVRKSSNVAQRNAQCTGQDSFTFKYLNYFIISFLAIF